MKKELIPALTVAVSFLVGGCCNCCMNDKGKMSGRWEYRPGIMSLALYTSSGTQLGVIKMVKNKEFCRPTEEGKSLEFAPIILPPKTSAPTEEEYNAANWFRNGIEPPNPPEGKVVSSTTYVVDADLNMVVAEYTYVDAPPPSLEEYDAAMEDYLRQEREERGYTTREPDSYLTSNVPRWAQDAKDWVAHRDAVMEYALELINEVSAGTREPPTMEEFLANMPKIEWSYELGE